MMPAQAALNVSQIDLPRLATLIERNETGATQAHLTFWSAKEPFPSFGIGHFIWVPPGVSVPFEATFLPMVRYVDQLHPAPSWLQAPKPVFPWRDRADFYQAWSSERLAGLRHWLQQTKPEQAAFIVHRFKTQLKKRLQTVSAPQAQRLRQRLSALTAFEAGMLACVDYANFKGLGANLKERYQGFGWGLLDVLVAMPPQAFAAPVSPKQTLTRFIHTAKAVLKRRTQWAPAHRNEERWLPGWYARVERYGAWLDDDNLAQ